MKCILRVGIEKTGTTSLQQFLDSNRESLLNQGYLYTRSAGAKNNRFLAVAAYNPGRRDELTEDRRILVDKDLAVYQTTLINGLKKELKQFQGAHTVIFSSEYFQSRLTKDDELIRLKELLGGLGLEQISIVVYLRNPVEIANSMYTEAIKAGYTEPNPPGPEQEYFGNLCDHRNTLVRFRDIFGPKAIFPRIYSKADLVNGSTIDDFLDTIGLPFEKDQYSMPELQNESMTVLGLELLRRLTKICQGGQMSGIRIHSARKWLDTS